MDDQLFYCPNYTLNIEVIEANDVPSMNSNGTSDPYIKLYLLGPKQSDKIKEVQTKIIKKTLNPIWNEEFHFPIKSLGTDVLHMSFKDYKTIGKDDPISKYDLQIRDLILGQVYDEWISFLPVKGVQKGGLIHLKYHLAPPGSYAFINNPIETKSFNIKIIEAKDLKSMDLTGFVNPFCQMQIIGDRTFSKTSIKYQTLSPYWDESFNFIITHYEMDIFKIDLMDKGKFTKENIGTINLKINQYEIGKVYKKWIEVKNKNKKVGLIRVMININKTGEEPFLGEIIEEKKNFIRSDKWEVNIHLIKAKNLPPVDSNDLSDPYVVFSILNTKISIKSRRIDKCLNPIWDEYFSIPINSLNSDILRIEIIDWNKIAKHDKLCMMDFPLKRYEFGKIYSGIYSLIPLGKKPGGSTIELEFQITPPFIIPFTEEIYNPDLLKIKIEDISGVTVKKVLKKPKFYFNLKLEKDSNDGIKSKIKEELNSVINEEFNFIITNKSKDKLIIEYKNETDKNKIISKCIILLKDFKEGVTEERKISMEPCGLIHLNIKISKKYPSIENNEEDKNILGQKKDENEKYIEDCLNYFEKKISKKFVNKNDKESIEINNNNIINNNIIIDEKKEKKKLQTLEEIIATKDDEKIESDNLNSIEQKEPKNQEKKEEMNKNENIKESQDKRINNQIKNEDKNTIITINSNEITNVYIKTNEESLNIDKNKYNNKVRIKKENDVNKNIDIIEKQTDDVKMMIGNPILDNKIQEKEFLEFPFNNSKEIKCCPDCFIF